MNEMITINKMIEIGKLQKKLDMNRFNDVRECLNNPNAISILYLKEDYETETLGVIEYYELYLLRLATKKDRDTIIKKWNRILTNAISVSYETSIENIIKLLEHAYINLVNKKITGFN